MFYFQIPYYVSLASSSGTGNLSIQITTVSTSGYMKPEAVTDIIIGTMSLTAVGVIHPQATGVLVTEIAELNTSGTEEFIGTASIEAQIATLVSSAITYQNVTGTADEGEEPLGGLAWQGVGEGETYFELSATGLAGVATSVGDLEVQPSVLSAVGVAGAVATGDIVVQELTLSASAIEKLLSTGVLDIQDAELVAAGWMKPEGLTDITIETVVLTSTGVTGESEGTATLIINFPTTTTNGVIEPVGTTILEVTTPTISTSGTLPDAGVNNFRPIRLRRRLNPRG